MTEIPEHLLKRSRERRSAIGKGDDATASADDAAAASTPATTASSAPATREVAPAASSPAARAAAPAPAAPPPPKPDPPYVAAAKRRKKIPIWAMATLSLMPVWAFMYVRAVTAPPETVEGPIGVGTGIYSNCASCHGAAGGGGVGYAFDGGSVLATFPLIEDQIRYVYYGTEGFNAAGVDVYGNPDREGGAHVTGDKGVMPKFNGQLTQDEIVAVVCHERYDLGGADPTSAEYSEEYEAWCAPESPIYAELVSGAYDFTSDATEVGGVEVIPVGPEAIPGSPAPAG